MNESSNENQGISGRAVATTLGLGGSIALTGAGLLMGRKALSPKVNKDAKAVSKNLKNVKNVKEAQSDYLKKHYKEMVQQVKNR